MHQDRVITDMLLLVYNIISVLISLAFIYSVCKHLINPDKDVYFTKILVLVYMAVIPTVFINIGLIQVYNEEFTVEIVIISLLFILMPFCMLVGLSFAIIGRENAVIFLIYYIPYIPLDRSSEFVIFKPFYSVLLYFAAAFIAVPILTINKGLVKKYSQHFEKVWRDYDTGATLFLSVCIFGILTQLINMVSVF
ncbi:hypothetical protein [Candidatus Francisella endociliophora]|uniref:hypothetical protein n=1 Tax=Candidatus Francisella endociliophora TaxID=653937 RepID=UPI0009E0860F|nr:hypothetical protein [Francisella sp. FSC1006]